MVLVAVALEVQVPDQEQHNDALKGPALKEIGSDLQRIPGYRLWISITGPFLWAAGYFVLASKGAWVPAIACTVALSFVTYGSISHDLVHRNLSLSRRVNDLFLVLIELLAFRSGTAYRIVHLHHHRTFPGDDDIEGAAAKMSLPVKK